MVSNKELCDIFLIVKMWLPLIIIIIINMNYIQH